MTDTSAIYRKYQSPLRRFIAGRVPSKEDCEDILQDVFYSLAKINLAENPIEEISAWLYAVARNRIIDRNRKHREERVLYRPEAGDETSFMNELTEALADEGASPETDFLHSLVWIALEKALAELPAEQRNVFELTELQGFSFKEISKATQIPVNTLISRKRYAVLHLRIQLYDLYDELLTD
jgi:RNA polymerase sigma factor (sigma-70 family)